MEKKKKQNHSRLEEDLIPGIPNDVALLCLARLPQRARARCCCVSRAFRKALSNGELMDRVCQEQVLLSKHRLVFLCLGTENEEFFEDEDEGNVMFTGFMWLILDPHTFKWEVIFDLPRLGPDLRCRSIRLAAGHHPGQVLIHGLIKKYSPCDECHWKQQSQIWTFDLFSLKIFPCIKSRVYRTNFVWANMNGEVYVAGGRPCPDRVDIPPLVEARNYYGTKTVNEAYLNSNPDEDFSDLPIIGEDDINDGNECISFGDVDESRSDIHIDDDDDPNNGNWYPISKLNEARECCAGFVLNGHFYVLGGISEDGDPIDSGEFYDPGSNDWIVIKNMWPYGEDDESPTIAVVNNKLYALKPRTTEIICYDELKACWNKFADLPETCRVSEQYRLLAVGEELWVFHNDLPQRKFSVLSCMPQSGDGDLNWRKPFKDLPSGLYILECVTIEV